MSPEAKGMSLSLKGWLAPFSAWEQAVPCISVGLEKSDFFLFSLVHPSYFTYFLE